ncbi:uncharacterized protein LOC141853044 [Brevipalpus obovatus]|uniref:uncharacterized protein LOC141853044 n=1 Tax=Brevipalpus obovatus TaxID=246614 RepID=UPI003D9EFC35
MATTYLNRIGNQVLSRVSTIKGLSTITDHSQLIRCFSSLRLSSQSSSYSNTADRGDRNGLLVASCPAIQIQCSRNLIERPRPPEDAPPRTSFSKSVKYQVPKPKFAENWKHMKSDQMKKHQRIKWRKKWAHRLRQTRLLRNIQKEKTFRSEILGRVLEAEKFNAEKYVQDVFQTIDTAPPDKKEKDDQHLINVYKLIAKYRSDTHLVRPYFDDPVPRKYQDQKLFKSK